MHSGSWSQSELNKIIAVLSGDHLFNFSCVSDNFKDIYTTSLLILNGDCILKCVLLTYIALPIFFGSCYKNERYADSRKDKCVELVFKKQVLCHLRGKVHFMYNS